MSIIKSVVIYGCGEGSTGASLAMALAGKPVHVFACWLNLWEMSELEDIPNITTLKMNPISPSEAGTMKELLTTRLGGGQINMLINIGSVGQEREREYGCSAQQGCVKE